MTSDINFTSAESIIRETLQAYLEDRGLTSPADLTPEQQEEVRIIAMRKVREWIEE